MRIAAVIVGTDAPRFRSVEANRERIELARRIADYVQPRARADLVLLPAGFLAAASSSTAALCEKAVELAGLFPEVDILAGIDLVRHGHADTKRTDLWRKDPGRQDSLPFWAFGARRGVVGRISRQRTARPGDTTDDLEGRCYNLAGAKVGLLICGELYSPELAEQLGRERPDVVVDLGHRGMGRKFTFTLLNVARAAGCPIVHAQHVALASRGASKWAATAEEAWPDKSYDWASYEDSAPGRDRLWAEVKVWRWKRGRVGPVDGDG